MNVMEGRRGIEGSRMERIGNRRIKVTEGRYKGDRGK
jgi:hypothetical protein